MSELESVRIGKCQNWKGSQLESVRIGNGQSPSSLESVRNCLDLKVSELALIRKSQERHSCWMIHARVLEVHSKEDQRLFV